MNMLTGFLPGRIFVPVLNDLVAPGIFGIPFELLIIVGLAIAAVSIITAVILIVLDKKKGKKKGK
ncbi:MAG: hypothetical protein IJM50_02475 [Lachnospiraceae bacterium]|nr:hypothetical protein [Lachnospiraceae bacterium]